MNQGSPAKVFGPKVQETFDKLSEECLTNSILIEHSDLLVLTYGSELRVQDIQIRDHRISLHFDQLYFKHYKYTLPDSISMEEIADQIIAVASTESNTLLLTYLLQNAEIAGTILVNKNFEEACSMLKGVENILMSESQFRKNERGFTNVSPQQEGKISKAICAESMVFGLPEIYNHYMEDKIIFTSAPNKVGFFKRNMQLNETPDSGDIIVSQEIVTRNRATVFVLILPK